MKTKPTQPAWGDEWGEHTDVYVRPEGYVQLRSWLAGRSHVNDCPDRVQLNIDCQCRASDRIDYHAAERLRDWLNVWLDKHTPV